MTSKPRRKHRRHSMATKREVVETYLDGEPISALARRYDLSPTLIQVWLDKYEQGEFDDEAVEEDLVPDYEARIAALERLVGRQALEIEFLKRVRAHQRSRRSANTSVITGPPASRSDGGAS